MSYSEKNHNSESESIKLSWNRADDNNSGVYLTGIIISFVCLTEHIKSSNEVCSFTRAFLADFINATPGLRHKVSYTKISSTDKCANVNVCRQGNAFMHVCVVRMGVCLCGPHASTFPYNSVRILTYKPNEWNRLESMLLSAAWASFISLCKWRCA